MPDKYKGSITAQAAMVLPVFMIGMAALLSLVNMMIFRGALQQALFTESQQLSYELRDGHSTCVSSVKEDVKGILDRQNTGFGSIRDGWDGVDFSGSRLNNPEYVEIEAVYEYVPVGADFMGIMEIPISQKSVAHVWCGYIDGFFAGVDEDEYVYICNDSEVYHRDRECSHIRLSVRSVKGDEIENLRNVSGEKYHSCEICHSRLSDPHLYITDDGNRFHNSLSCSGLKRYVRAVRITEASNRRPCSRCGR